MASETTLKLPAIDFSNEELKPGTEVWESVKYQVRKALEDYGCFEAFFNKVPADLRKSILGAIEEVLELPLETKLRNVSKKPFHGYFGQLLVAPLYESMGIDDANVAEMVETFANVLWPQGNPTFSKTVQSFTEQLAELDKIVRRMTVESRGLEKYMDEHLDSTNYLLRVMKYKVPETSDTELGLRSHTDKNIVTILYQNEVDGLEVQTKNGEWFSVKPSPDSFVVMIGDSLNAWVNGRLHSPYHRVMMTGNQTRYSCGLFSIPKAGYIIKAPEELIDEEHPLQFKPFDQVEFFKFYYTEAGRRAESALHTYCGV
ncbi:probable 2-oxoglutarate-dependent dioxygenase AOP1.2 [Mercurialis annua]|uniref:probable 2-oxoglutarate-dependent dioxygenase AOP1.2 n=1 Tax=Mercurialis annua TaxID=3986 RepID=UPI00215F5FFD|nr:probable 2-oxoglutarate-dependent dioxygenase AOP1.2 [Mercurialis annua]